MKSGVVHVSEWPEACAPFSFEALLLAEHMNIDRVHVVSSMSWQGRLCVENKGIKIVGEGQGLLLDGKWQFSEGSAGTFINLSLTNGEFFECAPAVCEQTE